MEQDFITKKTEWVRSIKIGESKTCTVKSHNELDSFATIVGRYNRGYGRERGIFISYTTDWFNFAFTITAMARDEKNS